MRRDFKKRINELADKLEELQTEFDGIKNDFDDWYNDHDYSWQSTPTGEKAYDEQVALDYIDFESFISELRECTEN